MSQVLVIAYPSIIAMLLFVVVMVWVQHNRQTVLLLSIRNFFLAGFCFFQLIAIIYWIHDPLRYPHWKLSRPASDLLEYLSMAFLFLLFFFVAYHKFQFVAKRYQRFRFTPRIPSDSQLILLAFMMSVIGLGLTLAPLGKYAIIISNYAGIGIGAASCGLAAWVLISHLKNPFAVTYCLGIIGINILSQLGGYSRRHLLSMGIAVLWAVFYKVLYRRRTRSLILGVVVLMLPPFLVVSAFSGIRKNTGMSVSEAVSKIDMNALWKGMEHLVGHSDTGKASLWMIENYPEKYRYRHMFTPFYTFAIVIPRAIWHDKPQTLSYVAVENLRMVNVGGFNIGPGIIGHAAAEGGFYAVIVYAILAGFMTRFLDDILKLNITNVFVVIPFGAMLGEVIGIARGETSFMIGVAANGMFVAFLLLMIFSKLIGRPAYPAMTPYRY